MPVNRQTTNVALRDFRYFTDHCVIEVFVAKQIMFVRQMSFALYFGNFFVISLTQSQISILLSLQQC